MSVVNLARIRTRVVVITRQTGVCVAAGLRRAKPADLLRCFSKYLRTRRFDGGRGGRVTFFKSASEAPESKKPVARNTEEDSSSKEQR